MLLVQVYCAVCSAFSVLGLATDKTECTIYCHYATFQFNRGWGGWVNFWDNLIFNETRSSESDGRSDVTDSLDCPDKFRLP